MLAVNRVSKSFPGVRALSDVSLAVADGEIHALAGENGAGKSTLTKIMAGVYRPDHGDLLLDGRPVHWLSPAHAQRHGVQVIYQELVQFPNLSVAENIFIGKEPRGALGLLTKHRTEIAALKVLKELGVELAPNALVGDLSIADRQMIEIAKALVREVRVLILDEPTGVLADHEASVLFARLRTLRRNGVAIVYISHRLEEVLELADRVTVLKDGAVVGSYVTDTITRDSLITLMVGRDLGPLFPSKRPPRLQRESVLHIEGLTVPQRVKGVSFELFAGEITALAGLAGAGRSELAMAVFGALPATSGSVTLDGVKHKYMTPARAISCGIGLVSEDRKAQGLAMQLDITTNLTAPRLGIFTRRGLLNRAAEVAVARTAIQRFHISCRGPGTVVMTLSGGNQQKLLVARWADIARRVLILDEPTRGVDVAARQEIYRLIHQLANSGIAVLMISSDLPEVVGMADRVIVMREGIIAGELTGEDISEERVMRLSAHTRQPTADDSSFHKSKGEDLAQAPDAVA